MRTLRNFQTVSEEEFSETPIQLVASLCVRTAATGISGDLELRPSLYILWCCIGMQLVEFGNVDD
jgi:hypothetical protein